jgi:drug/metabolite transporter (DMT)-like permease
MTQPVKAAMLMLAGMLAFSIMSALVRLAAGQIHSFEVAFFRNILAVLMFLPLIMRKGPAMMRSKQPKLHLARAGLGAMAMMSFFTALTHIPLAEATALGFASPFFATLGAVLFLGERIKFHRSAALIVGFIGVMIVLRPGYVDFSLGAGLMLLSAGLIGITAVLVKKLSATDAPEAIAIWMVVLQTPITLIAALFVWEWPTGQTFLYLLGLAFAGTVGHLCWTRAMSIAEVSQLQPFEFAKLPFVAMIGFFVFSEVPTHWVWIGGAIIFAANGYITHRESRLARKNASAAASHGSRPTPL